MNATTANNFKNTVTLKLIRHLLDRETDLARKRAGYFIDTLLVRARADRDIELAHKIVETLSPEIVTLVRKFLETHGYALTKDSTTQNKYSRQTFELWQAIAQQSLLTLILTDETWINSDIDRTISDVPIRQEILIRSIFGMASHEHRDILYYTYMSNLSFPHDYRYYLGCLEKQDPSDSAANSKRALRWALLRSDYIPHYAKFKHQSAARIYVKLLHKYGKGHSKVSAAQTEMEMAGKAASKYGGTSVFYFHFFGGKSRLWDRLLFIAKSSLGYKPQYVEKKDPNIVDGVELDLQEVVDQSRLEPVLMDRMETFLHDHSDEVLESLTPREASIVQYLFVVQTRPDQIADILGISRTTYLNNLRAIGPKLSELYNELKQQ